MPTTLKKKAPKWQKAKKQAEPEPENNEPLFKNPFQIDDLMVLDDPTLRELITKGMFGVKPSDVALALHKADVNGEIVKRIYRNLPSRKRIMFKEALEKPATQTDIKQARRTVLDGMFWELTYWKTPELYEELTAGEKIHPTIFKKLKADIHGKHVLDAGAGSGRASFEALRHGAKLVYAIEPSLGLLNILEKKLAEQAEQSKIVPVQGRFDKLPLEESSVDVIISCSAFTADPHQGGENGLAEFKRVTKNDGKIIIIWPRTEDHDWLSEQGFEYVSIPIKQEMKVQFDSLKSALRCARRFYGRNKKVSDYLRETKKPEIPFSVIGLNTPNDYYWLKVQKSA